MEQPIQKKRRPNMEGELQWDMGWWGDGGVGGMGVGVCGGVEVDVEVEVEVGGDVEGVEVKEGEEVVEEGEEVEVVDFTYDNSKTVAVET